MILTNRYKRITDGLLAKKDEKIRLLEEELEKAKDLKSILHELTQKTFKFDAVSDGILGMADIELGLSDAIPRYVEDYFGGKVIKQEATKVIAITAEGEVKTGLTKQTPDEGYKYKLIRE